ncbi:hypothetical protein BO71DRAFT_325470 [Aspergillus ellipticus CBS 707.79]|uniref:Uncharacterized protein n=1 Tax=Aspergillus ellipticus CBS 707.79 TaxID=1448320 RepID=A0A319DAK2_9EURO|nr:hypothetical protein BO71DRAFT_325470 [Aspergillus ellipticus CBS 707.79]
MGGFLSIQSKDKRRRSNRLSKPPPNKATLASASSHTSHQASGSNSACSPVGEWQNPWTGTSIPINSPDPGVAGRRSQSLPSVSYQPGAPWPVVDRARKCQSIVKESGDLCLRSPTPTTAISSPLSRRASLQTSKQGTFHQAAPWNGPRASMVHQPRRSFSAHSPPHRTQTAIHRSTIEEATSSNTLFMVDSQGFSLIRRRSLLTRPGVATRRSTRDATRRLPSSVGQEINLPKNYGNEARVSPQLLLSCEKDTGLGPSVPLAQLRPPTPSDFEYTHLGALKLGSLRVVNSSTSPCPSDRARLNRPSSPTLEASQVYTHHLDLIRHNEDHSYMPKPKMHESYDGVKPQIPCDRVFDDYQNAEGAGGNLQGKRNSSVDTLSTGLHRARPSTSKLKIPTVSGPDKHDEYPASPFSFDRSPTITSPHIFRTDETEYEEVSALTVEKIATPPLEPDFQEKKLQHSHRKADSGYSSAASDRSLQDTHLRSSTDSRRFILSGSSRDLEIQHAQNFPGLCNQLPVHRHSSLQGPGTRFKANCGWPTNTSSMCHDNQQNPVEERVRGVSFVDVPESTNVMPFSHYCHHLRKLESALPELSVAPAQILSHRESENQKKGSYILSEEDSTGKSPSSAASDFDTPDPSVANGTDSLPSPRFDALRMPISEEMGNVDSGSIGSPGSPGLEPPRGRARSRSVEYQQKSLAKYAKRSNLYIAASPFIFH